MGIVNRIRPIPQAAPEWIMKPLWAECGDETIPGGKTGLLKMEDGQVYLVTPIDNDVVGHGFTMVKANGELHLTNLLANRGVGTCSCKAFQYRRQNVPCKHIMQLREALNQLTKADADPVGYCPFDTVDEGQYDYTPPRAFFGHGHDNPTPPTSPAALPIPARKPNHRFVADVA